MRPAITIRPATPEDAPLVLSFITELAEFEKLSDGVSATEELVRETLFGPEKFAYALLAFCGEAPAGFAVYFFTYSTFRAKPGLWLEDLFVRPALRGRGIGRRLFQELFRIAAQKNCARFEWSVLNWNERAMEFYEKLGARPLKEWTTYRLEEEQIRQLAIGQKSLQDV